MASLHPYLRFDGNCARCNPISMWILRDVNQTSCFFPRGESLDGCDTMNACASMSEDVPGDLRGEPKASRLSPGLRPIV